MKTRDELTNELERLGLIVKKTVTKDLDFVISLDGVENNKTRRARELNIPIYGPEKLNEILNEL